MALINSFWSRHKRLLFVLALFLAPFASLFLLKVNLPRIHVYDEIQALFVHPASEVVGNATGGAGVLWSRYIAVMNAATENEQLKKDIAALKQKITEIEELGRENERLRKIVSMPDFAPRKGIVAKIIGQDSTHESLSFVINAGTAQGVEARMPVVHAEGVVGTVVRAYRNSSVFVSFLDPSHDLDGIVTRSRARLIVEGKGRTLLARLKYLDRSEDIRVGDLVLSGGLDGVFPKGLPIGNIVKVDKPDGGVTQEAELRAAVDPGHLEEVTVLRAPSEEVPEASLTQGPQQL
ncbi:MAG: rod shape-determining protein MreC [Bdellovibrionales bacterium]|nr:rod shape-determining protein MreC [Bdellovibrionales bacterium]